jgi:excisionase family DNA binding protein
VAPGADLDASYTPSWVEEVEGRRALGLPLEPVQVATAQPLPESAASELRRLTEEVRAGLRRLAPPMLATLPEAAEHLGVSLSTLRRRIKDGSIPARRIGRALRVDLAALRPLTTAEVARMAREARNGSLPSQGMDRS